MKLTEEQIKMLSNEDFQKGFRLIEENLEDDEWCKEAHKIVKLKE